MKQKRIEDRRWRIATNRARPRALCSILYLLSSILSLHSLTGCAAVGVVAHKVVGNPDVPAKYRPAKEPMLVFVENYRNPSPVRLDAQRLTLHVVDEIRRHKIAPIVDADAMESLRSRPEFRTMKVEEVGRAAGAKQVLYINLQHFAIDDTVGGEMMKGHAEFRVRVVDVETAQTRWPRAVPEGYALAVETQWTRSTIGSREGATEPAMRNRIARDAASQIVKLFRKWDPDDDPSELEETVH